MRVIYEKGTMNIVQIVEGVDESSVSHLPASMGAIQGDLDEIASAGYLLGIDVSQIPGINMTLEQQRVLKKRKKGQDIFNRFLSENEHIEISTEDNLTLLAQLMPVKQMLESGALATARDILSLIPGELFFVTPGYESGEQRKQSYITEINDFIQSLELLNQNP